MCWFCYHNGVQALDRMEWEFNQEGVAEHAAYPIRIGSVMGRGDLAGMLMGQCKRLGIPITWGVSIDDFEDNGDHGVAIASDGTQYKADLILAADGIGSKSQKLILGAPVRAVSTGCTTFRAAILTKDLEDAPLIKEALHQNKRAQFRYYCGGGGHMVLVISERLISMAITLPEVGSQLGRAYCAADH